MFRKFLMISALAAVGMTAGACTKNAETSNTEIVNAEAAETVTYADAQTALADGNRFFDENLTEKAVDAYKQATKLDPDLAEAHFKLGLAYALLESEQELIATPAEPVSDTEDKDEKPKKEKKSNSVLAFENAVIAYKKLIDKDSKDHSAHFNLGRVYDRLNEDKDARKSLETAVKLEPENTLYQTELGAVLIKLAQYDEAVRALKKAVELDEGNALAAELLEKAEAGKKRVDYGADAIKKTLKEKDSRGSSRSDDDDEDDSKKGDDNKSTDKQETDKKKEPAKTPPAQPKKSSSSSTR